MPDSHWVEQVVEKAVSQALESGLPQLRQELVRSVVEQVRTTLEGNAAQSLNNNPQADPEPHGDLLRAIASIHAGTSQKEILRALLDSTAHYSGRSALFVVRSGLATGWQARGFANSEAIKDFVLDATGGVVGQALQSRLASRGMAEQVDPAFVSNFGASTDRRVLILPLLLKDKVAALVYTDAGTDEGGTIATDALEILVTATSAWLEVASLRKQTQKDGVSDAIAERFDGSGPAQTAPAFPDPFASHPPTHLAAAPTGSTAEAAVERAPLAVAAAAPSSSAPASSAPAAGQEISADDGDMHRKAQRFARLLSDEIKLYNQAKVAEGRKNRDLYDRLKEDIDKSRVTYQKRYGNTVAAGADYFNHELIRSLAEDDASLMGLNFVVKPASN
jgi:hypothetical protein